MKQDAEHDTVVIESEEERQARLKRYEPPKLTRYFIEDQTGSGFGYLQETDGVGGDGFWGS